MVLRFMAQFVNTGQVGHLQRLVHASFSWSLSRLGQDSSLKRQNTLQDPFLLHSFSSLYVAVCHVCTCPYGTGVFLLGATVYFGTGTLATPGTHPLASLTGRKSPRSPFLLPGTGTADVLRHTWLCVCVQVPGDLKSGLRASAPSTLPTEPSPQPSSLTAIYFFLKFVQCETDLHTH